MRQGKGLSWRFLTVFLLALVLTQVGARYCMPRALADTIHAGSFISDGLNQGRNDEVLTHVNEAIQKHYRHTTPYYDVVILTSPVRIESLAIDPSGRGRHMGVVNNYGRMGSGIFASYGEFSHFEDRAIMAGRPKRVRVSESALILESIPIGSTGLYADWSFTFHQKTFDIALDWHVIQRQIGIWEAGWKLDSIARHIGDNHGDKLSSGGRGSFRDRSGVYVAWSEDDPRYAHTLVAAYVPGSADRGDLLWVEKDYGRPVTWALWATVSVNRGTTLHPGTIRGGRWRIGASGVAHDHEYARALAGEVAGGPEAVPNPGHSSQSEEMSERDEAVAFAEQLPLPAEWKTLSENEDSGPLTVRYVGEGSNRHVLFSDGSVLAAFVRVGSEPSNGTVVDAYRVWFYVSGDNRWQLAATGGPSRQITDVTDGGHGTLVVQAHGIGPDGSVQTVTKETWRLQSQVHGNEGGETEKIQGNGSDRPCGADTWPGSDLYEAEVTGVIHIHSVDTPVSGHTAHQMHSYLVYPREQTKHEIGSYDVIASPSLTPRADFVTGQRVFWSPALQVQHDDVSVALIPDLLTHREPGNYGAMPQATYFGLALNLDTANRLVDAPALEFGWRTVEGAFGYYYRDTGQTPDTPVTIAYDLVFRSGASPYSVTSDVQRRLWDTVGNRHFSQSLIPQTQPANDAFDEAWSYWESQYGERIIDGERRGAVLINREFPPDIMFMSWFNALRSSYGLYSYGQERGDEELMAKGRATLNLILSAPRERGAFPTVAGLRARGFEWYGSQRNFANQMPWGPDSYATFDMGWAAYWVLRWYQDLIPDERALNFAREYGEFLLDVQFPNGAVPSWIERGTLEILPYLRESAHTASSIMFLAELAKVTGDRRYMEAAEKAGEFVIENNLLEQRWDDFEPYYSNAPKSEGASDPLSSQFTQNTLSMHFAALGFLTLYELTGNETWIVHGQQAVDAYLQYQYVDPGIGLSLNSFGGFAVQNTDNEAVDARQSQFGITLLDYARVTGRQDYAERGVAALRAGFSTMASPSAEIINPAYFDAYPIGYGPENYAHATYDTTAGYTAFDWGQGSAAAGFAEARNRFGDVWVDVASGMAVGIDFVQVNAMRFDGATLHLELTSPAPDHTVLLKVFGVERVSIEVHVNGHHLGDWTKDQLEAGIKVPAERSTHIVHNPLRTDTAIVGQPYSVHARVIPSVSASRVMLHYRSGDEAWQRVEMSRADTSIGHYTNEAWSGVIPGSAVVSGERLEYYITAYGSVLSEADSAGVGAVQIDQPLARSPLVDPERFPFAVTPIEAEVVETPFYRLVISTGDHPGIVSLEADPHGNGAYRRVMSEGGRGTIPYAAVGAWGDTDRPGRPLQVEMSPDGKGLRLIGIPIGDEPMTVDWTFRFDEKSFDHGMDWHVKARTNAGLWEVAWNWDTLLDQIGDSEQTRRPSGDVSRFPDWVMAYDGEITLVAAYRSGSAWSKNNRYYHGSSVVWQPLWQPGGRSLAPGTYSGGWWRIGMSSRPADASFAARLHRELNIEE